MRFAPLDATGSERLHSGTIDATLVFHDIGGLVAGSAINMPVESAVNNFNHILDSRQCMKQNPATLELDAMLNSVLEVTADLSLFALP